MLDRIVVHRSDRIVHFTLSFLNVWSLLQHVFVPISCSVILHRQNHAQHRLLSSTYTHIVCKVSFKGLARSVYCMRARITITAFQTGRGTYFRNGQRVLRVSSRQHGRKFDVVIYRTHFRRTCTRTRDGGTPSATAFPPRPI